jgi:hypothetical protein
MVAVLALAAVGLSGCAQGDVDREAWRAALADAGAPSADLDKLEPLVRDDCEKDDDALALMIAVTSDEGGDEAVERMRLNMRYVCPDEVERFDAAIADARQGSERAERICDKPAAERTDEERMVAEATGC